MRKVRAFTLLEVMIAMGIFFMAIFAILDLVALSLKSTRALRPHNVDASSLAAELMLTNRMEEGSWSGDFGNLHPGYSWTKDVTLISTNGLFQVDFVVSRDDGGEGNQTHMSVLVFRPESQIRPGGGARGGLR